MDIKTYKGRLYKLKIIRYNEALKKLEKMKEKGISLLPVMENTVEAFKVNMRADFRARQTPDEPPMRWTKLSKKYSKWKFKKYGRRVSDLVLTGRLKKAVDGGLGWYQIIGNTRAEFGITGIPYAATHQYGYIPHKLPPRRYFLASGNKLPMAVNNYLLGQIEKTFYEAFS